MTTEEKKWDREWTLSVVATHFVNPLGVPKNKILEALSANCPKKEELGREDILILIKTSSESISVEEVENCTNEIMDRLKFLKNLGFER